MTVKLERLFDGSRSDQNFATLQLIIDRLLDADKSFGLRLGTGTATWTAAAGSANVTVTHGLGSVPIVAITGTRDDLFGYAVTARSATTLTVKGFTTHNAAVTTSRTFDWVVIG